MMRLNATIVLCIWSWAVHAFTTRHLKTVSNWARYESKREPWDIIHPVQPSNPYEKRQNSGFKTVAEYNWKYGMCNTKIVFEVRNILVIRKLDNFKIYCPGRIEYQAIPLLRKSPRFRFYGRKSMPYSPMHGGSFG